MNLSADKYVRLLGKNIHNVISKSKYKQTEIAKKLKVDNSTISRWVNGGRIPTANNLIELAKILNIDVADFWKHLDTTNMSSEYKQLLNLLNQLTEKQIIAVLEIVKSMLPAPELQDFLNEVSQLDAEQRKAVVTLVRSSNKKNESQDIKNNENT